MKAFSKKVSLIFSAGSLGGFANGIAVWLFGSLGITTALGVNIAPQFSAGYIYQRIVWGGIWGVLFLFPCFKKSPLARGLVNSLGPTIIQLVVVFPLKAQKGVFGLQLGYLTPLFVVIFNAVWGIVASYWLRYVHEKK
jgi:hypothetical protein